MFSLPTLNSSIILLSTTLLNSPPKTLAIKQKISGHKASLNLRPLKDLNPPLGEPFNTIKKQELRPPLIHFLHSLLKPFVSQTLDEMLGH